MPNRKPSSKALSPDVLIVGGGLAGLTLAGVLGAAGVETVIVDREDPAAQLKERFDARTTAISYASSQVLEAAGVWQGLLKDAGPILDIRVADGASPLFLHFDADDNTEGRPFGWIVENRLLRRVLLDNLKRFKNVRHIAPVTIRKFFRTSARAGVELAGGRKISAPLLVGADGRGSGTRAWLGIGVTQWEYRQAAVVCNAVHERDHENAAVEHFLPEGPFAVLPMTRAKNGAFRSSVVWTVREEEAPDILKLAPKDFDARLQHLFGPHLGRVRQDSAPMAYPLRLLHAKAYAGERAVLLAEAAHVIHPIAGQGLNVSMRDIAVLAELIVDALKLGLDAGRHSVLSQYEDWRRPDTLLMAGFTDILNRLFSNNLFSAAVARDLGIGMIDKISPLKGFFARQAMGLGGKSPRILREGRL
jgi:2-octaprenyl-6-methoxyphenol hydroxylase